MGTHQITAAVFSSSCTKALLTEPSEELRRFSYLVPETKRQSRRQTWGSIQSAGFRMPTASSRGHETMFSLSYLRPGEGGESNQINISNMKKKRRPENEFQWSIAMGNLTAPTSHVQQAPRWKKNEETLWTLKLVGGISQRSSRLVPNPWVWQKRFQ